MARLEIPFALLSSPNPKYIIVRKDDINQEKTKVILTEGSLLGDQEKKIKRENKPNTNPNLP